MGVTGSYALKALSWPHHGEVDECGRSNFDRLESVEWTPVREIFSDHLLSTFILYSSDGGNGGLLLLRQSRKTPVIED